MPGTRSRRGVAGGRRARRALAVLALSMVPSAVAVSNADAAVFYEQHTELWDIIGDTGNAGIGPTCRLAQNYRDGSYFAMYMNLQSGEIFIILSNAAWSIRGNEGDVLDVTYNFYTPRTVYDRLLGATFLMNANSIAIPNINANTFLEPFYYATDFEIIMPGNIPPVTVSLIGTAEGLTVLNDCVASAGGGQRTQTQAPQVQPLQPRPR